MPSVSFTIADFNISSSWKYAEAYDDVGDVTVDYKNGPTTGSATKTFTISGVDMSTVNSIILSWDISTSAYGSMTQPTKGWGTSYAKVYPGTSASGSYASGNSKKLDLTSYVSTNTSVSCFFQYKASIKQSDHDHYEGYGMGDCSSTAYFKNVTLTVTYGEERDDPGNGLWVGVSDVASKVKNMYIGVDGVARKIKAAWIGVNGVARLFYEAIVKVATTAAYSRANGDKTSATTLSIKAQDSDNIVLTFPANNAFLTCEKLTLHINSQSSSRTLKTIALRSGSTANNSMSTQAGIATPLPSYTTSGTGWQEIDVTAGFGDGGGTVTREQAATEGIKVWLRTSSGTCVISGVNSTECPYLLAE